MDVLSDVVTVMRTGAPRAALVSWHGAWTQRFSSVPGSAGFVAVIEGACRLTDDAGVTRVLGPGDVIVLPRGDGFVLSDDPPAGGARPHRHTGEPCAPRAAPHHLADRAGDPASDLVSAVTLCGAYEMDVVGVHPLLHDLPPMLHLTAAPAREPVDQLVEVLAGELRRPRLGGDVLAPALLDALLVVLLRRWFSQHADSGRSQGWSSALNDSSVARALSAIHREPERPWTTAQLGAEAGLSRSAFSRRFTSLVGQPPLGYLTWWRMSLASRLLRDSDTPLRVIASEVGYRSQYSFATAFKRHRGVPPGAFRKAQPAPSGHGTRSHVD